MSLVNMEIDSMKNTFYRLPLLITGFLISHLAAMDCDKAKGLTQKENRGLLQDTGSHLFPGIQKINANFYTARIHGKNLSLVMERIDARTKRLWQAYIEVQNNGRVIEIASKLLPGKGTTGDGAAHFEKVLKHISHEDNELWVAYITKEEKPGAIPDSIITYNADAVDSKSNSFAKNIEMYVTVCSTSNALISSNMGIASTAESLGDRTRGTSIDLLSFAAKVTLKRNPQRRFMVNAPIFPMEKIMVEALPHSIFVGTREMLKSVRDREKITFVDYKALMKKNIMNN